MAFIQSVWSGWAGSEDSAAPHSRSVFIPTKASSAGSGSFLEKDLPHSDGLCRCSQLESLKPNGPHVVPVHSHDMEASRLGQLWREDRLGSEVHPGGRLGQIRCFLKACLSSPCIVLENRLSRNPRSAELGQVICVSKPKGLS